MMEFRRCKPSRRIVLLLAVAGATLVACSSGGDAGSPASPWDGLAPSGLALDSTLGVSSHIDMGPAPSWTRDFELEKLAAAGMKRIRRDFFWGEIEPANDDWHFENTDTFVDQAASQGFEIDALLVYGVDWANPSGRTSEIPPAAYADFAGHVAAHYCDRIKTYEVWNEENLPSFWRPTPDPAAYAAMLAATYPAIKTACPDAAVLFGAINSLPYVADRLYGFLDTATQAMPAVRESFDALAIHPYTVLQHAPPEWSATLGGAPVPDLTGQIAIARDRLSAMQRESAPILLTEMGWPSWILSEEQQAAWTARGILLSAAAGADAYYTYTFWDGSGDAPLPTEDHFGLFTYPYADGGPRAKPAYHAVRGLHEVLGTSRYAGDRSVALGFPTGVYGLAFVEDGSGAVTLAGWDSRGPGGIDLVIPSPPGATSYRVYAQDGAPVGEGAAPTDLPVRLDERLTYVRFAR